MYRLHSGSCGLRFYESHDGAAVYGFNSIDMDNHKKVFTDKDLVWNSGATGTPEWCQDLCRVKMTKTLRLAFLLHGTNSGKKK